MQIRAQRGCHSFFFALSVLLLAFSGNGCGTAGKYGDALPEDLCNEPDEKNPATTVESILPSEGKRLGRTVVTIKGSGFKPGAAVLLGKVNCGGVSVVDATTITCMTPRHIPDTVDVVVANTNRECAAIPGGFTFLPSVVITPPTQALAIGNNFTFSASKGKRPYTYSVLSGGGTIDPQTGEFIAPDTPQTVGIRVTDDSGTTSEAVVTVLPALTLYAPKNIISPGTHPFTASGGVPPYAFSVSGSGSIDSATGLYTAGEEGETVTVRVDDSLGNSSELSVPINPPIRFTPENPIVAVNNRIKFTGGLAPLTFSIISGEGVIDENGFIAPNVPGTTALRITDASGNVHETLVTVKPQLVLYPETRTIIVGDSFTPVAMGGIPPYTFSLESGKGTVDSATGEYSAPEEPGQAVIQVTDSNGNSAQATVTINTEGLVLRKLVAGYAHTCALVDGGVVCWGANNFGQLGNGTTKSSVLPVAVKGLSDGVLAISAGLNHTCVLLSGGMMKCWGDNRLGQLGTNSTKSSPVPVLVYGISSGAQAISAGEFHTCAVINGSALCWGDNRRGQLGNDSTISSPIPVQVKGLTQNVQGIASGAAHSCGMVEDGVRCWGYNYSGQLGDGTTMTHLTSVPVRGLSGSVRSIESGGYHSCAIIADEGVKCWGYNGSGQLGINSTRNSLLPVEVKGLGKDVTALALGNYHSCAVAGSEVKCWGYNYDRQVDNKSTVPYLLPYTVPNLIPEIDAVAAGVNHSCVMAKQQAQCWGNNGLSGRFLDTPMELKTTPPPPKE